MHPPIKSIYAPHLGRHVKLGRRRPIARGPRLHLKNYLLPHLPPPPASTDWTPGGIACLRNLFLNDTYGDCVVAGGYHIAGVETGNATGTPFIATDAQIIKDYSAIGGYVPGDPSTDNGCDEQTAMNYWTQTGFANGTKLTGYMAIDATNPTEIQQALYLFENVLFGIELPDAWISPFPSTDGFVWTPGPANPQNGHCVIGAGYDSQGVKIATWGLLGSITWAAIAALCVPNAGGELYLLLSPDQIAKGTQKAPNGLLWADLAAAFQALAGNAPAPAPSPAPPPDPPAPTPVPPAPPTPAPSNGVTLEQAIAWATSGLTQNWPSDSATAPNAGKIALP